MLIRHQILFKKLFITEDGKRSKNWTKLFKGLDSKIKRKHPNIINYIKETFKDISEAYYILANDLEEIPKCPICGKSVEWHKFSYTRFCSQSCAAIYRAANEKQKKSNYVENIPDFSNEINYKKYDKIILNLMTCEGLYGNKSNAFRKLVSSPVYLNKYINIKSYFLYRFKDIVDKKSEVCADLCNEVLYRLKHNIEETPKCKICGKPIKFSKKKKYYKTYCSFSCKLRDPETQEYIHKVSFEKTGSINNAKKIRESHSKRTKEDVKKMVEKRKATNIANGHDENWTNVDKMISTNEERYGVRCTQQVPLVKHKTELYYLSYHGVMHQSQVPEIINKIKNSLKSYYNTLKENLTTEELQEYYADKRNKALNTIKNNGGNLGPKSNIEDKVYQLILQEFPDAIHHYTDKRYANDGGYEFDCDIYIPSKDAFIECQFHPAHGRHPYNENEDETNEYEWIFNHFCLRNYPEEKRLYTFTIGDPYKRNVAKKNELNYFELWKQRKLDVINLCRQLRKLPNRF